MTENMKDNEEFGRRMLSKIPMGRIGSLKRWPTASST